MVYARVMRRRATGFVPGCCKRGARRRGYSATTTTAAARDAAQIDCAALGEHELDAGGHGSQLTQWRHGQANSGASADRRSSAFGTPAARYRCRPSASKMNVVGSDSTERRRAALGLASISISTCATSPRSPHTWLTTRRTWVHGEHHEALKCTTVGPSPDRPKSLVSTSPAVLGSVARMSPARRVSSHPMTAASTNAAATATIAAINGLTPPGAHATRILARLKSCSVEPIESDR